MQETNLLNERYCNIYKKVSKNEFSVISHSHDCSRSIITNLAYKRIRTKKLLACICTYCYAVESYQ